MLTLAIWIVGLAGVYLACGLVFAIPFVLRGVNRLDPIAGESSWGFRVIIVPGVVALWPLLAQRWFQGAPAPYERNAHRDAARRAS